MKKFVLLMIAAITLSLMSCGGDRGPMGPEGPAGEGNNWKIVDVSVAPNSWTKTTGANPQDLYYSAAFRIPELNSIVYNDGIVLAYRDYGDTQQVLPLVIHDGETDSQGFYTWTQTIDFQYQEGQVSFYVTYSDFVETTPDAMNFRIVMIW